MKWQYKLSEKSMHNGWLYVEMREGMYGLLLAGLLAQELLEKTCGNITLDQSSFVLLPIILGKNMWGKDMQSI